MKPPGQRYILTSRQPATRWEDALPAGNGAIGALVYGNIRNETVVLNHDALWLRTEKPTMPDVHRHLPQLRRLLSEGHWIEATSFLSDRLADAGSPQRRPDPYLPVCDLTLEMDVAAPFTNYRRSVNLTTGEVSVSWRELDLQLERRLFVSRADDCIVITLRASAPGKQSCRLALAPRSLLDSRLPDASSDPNAVPCKFTVSAEDGWLFLVGRYDGAEFGAVARVVPAGGRLETAPDHVQVLSADEVIILIKLFADEPAAQAVPRLRSDLESLDPNYDALLRRHAPLHRDLFLRMRLDLHVPRKDDSLSNELLLLSAYDGNVPTALIQRLADFGRYLLISCSRPGGWPANLQGLWNGDYAPAWASDYHNDVNIQMNYWQALPGNLPEVTLPYFDYYESMLDDYRANAGAIFGCRGIMASLCQTTHGIAYSGPWLNWTAGAGWLAQLFYDYWLFTGDEHFLRRRAIPFLKEVALFYQDFLFQAEDGVLLFSPSLSPENQPDAPGAALAAINATMDVAVAREVLTNLCSACDHLGIERDAIPRWRAILAKLPDYQVNDDGALQEWLHPGLKDNYSHRHLSHLYPLFPGLEITEESSPSLFAAALIAVEKRLAHGLTFHTGWGYANLANAYARLGKGDRALECLELLARSCVGPNLFTYMADWRRQGLTERNDRWRKQPFQIDANLGLPAAVLEMLVFSQPGLIRLLPALPSKWTSGEAAGILCRGGVVVHVAWDTPKRRLRAQFLSNSAQTLTIKFPAPLRTISVDPPALSLSPSPLGDCFRTIPLPQNQPVTLTVTLEPPAQPPPPSP